MTTEKIVPNEKFALSLGTTDKIKPSALYLEGKCIITPLSKKDNYVKDINILRRVLKNATRDIFIKCDLFDNDFLFDIDIPNQISYVNNVFYYGFIIALNFIIIFALLVNHKKNIIHNI